MKLPVFVASMLAASAFAFALPARTPMAPLAPVAPIAPADCTGCTASSTPYSFGGAPNCSSDVSITLSQVQSGTCDLMSCLPATACKFTVRLGFGGTCLSYYHENTWTQTAGFATTGSVLYEFVKPTCGTSYSVFIETLEYIRLAQVDVACSSCLR